VCPCGICSRQQPKPYVQRLSTARVLAEPQKCEHEIRHIRAVSYPEFGLRTMRQPAACKDEYRTRRTTVVRHVRHTRLPSKQNAR
jgi:hypothetical protein